MIQFIDLYLKGRGVLTVGVIGRVVYRIQQGCCVTKRVKDSRSPLAHCSWFTFFGQHQSGISPLFNNPREILSNLKKFCLMAFRTWGEKAVHKERVEKPYLLGVDSQG